MLPVCLAASVHSHSLIAHTAAGCHFEEQLTFAFSLHQIHYWAWASDISDCVCLCVCTCMCVWWVTWAWPTDILLDANGIRRRGSRRGGGHGCPCVNGACRSPVGVVRLLLSVCVFVQSWWRLPWETDSTGWSQHLAYVYVNRVVCWQGNACLLVFVPLGV